MNFLRRLLRARKLAKLRRQLGDARLAYTVTMAGQTSELDLQRARSAAARVRDIQWQIVRLEDGS